jgi:hypothetical protein
MPNASDYLLINQSGVNKKISYLALKGDIQGGSTGAGYVLKSGDRMEGNLTLGPISGGDNITLDNDDGSASFGGGTTLIQPYNYNGGNTTSIDTGLIEFSVPSDFTGGDGNWRAVSVYNEPGDLVCGIWGDGKGNFSDLIQTSKGLRIDETTGNFFSDINTGIGGTSSAGLGIYRAGVLHAEWANALWIYTEGNAGSSTPGKIHIRKAVGGRNDGTSNAYVIHNYTGPKEGVEFNYFSYYTANYDSQYPGAIRTQSIGYLAQGNLSNLNAPVNIAFKSDINNVQNKFNFQFYANGSAPSYFGGDVGINTTDPQAPIDIAATGDGANLLRFETERPWVFRQINTGAGTKLNLHCESGAKDLIISARNSGGTDDVNAVRVFASDQPHVFVYGDFTANGEIKNSNATIGSDGIIYSKQTRATEFLWARQAAGSAGLYIDNSSGTANTNLAFQIRQAPVDTGSASIYGSYDGAFICGQYQATADTVIGSATIYCNNKTRPTLVLAENNNLLYSDIAILGNAVYRTSRQSHFVCGNGTDNYHAWWTGDEPGYLEGKKDCLERMRLNHIGNLGIGSNPAVKLDVNHTSDNLSEVARFTNTAGVRRGIEVICGNAGGANGINFSGFRMHNSDMDFAIRNQGNGDMIRITKAGVIKANGYSMANLTELT